MSFGPHMHGPALVMGGKETGRQRVQDPGRTELRTDMTWDGVLENWRGATCPRQRGDSPEPGHREETDSNRDRGGGGTGPLDRGRVEPDLSRQMGGCTILDGVGAKQL